MRGIGFQPVLSADRLEAYPTDSGNLASFEKQVSGMALATGS